MAISFGGELVDVTTPDGRTVKMPSGLAASFSGLTPPPMQPGMSDTDLQTFEPMIGQPGQTEPVPAPAPAPQPPAPQSPAPQLTQVQAPDAVSGPPPAPSRPMTTRDLREGGQAEVLNQSTTAVDKQQAAGEKVAQAQADEWEAQARNIAAGNQRADEIIAKRNAAIQENALALERKSTEYNGAIEKYANTKIDRSVDNPLLGVLAVVLGSVGSAMAGGDGMAGFNLLMKSIDRKVAGQQADLDKQKGVLDMRRQQIGDMRQMASDKTANYSLMMASEIERTKRLGDEITAKSSSPIVKARWEEERSKLDLKKAELTGVAVDKQHQADQQAKALAEQQAARKQQAAIAYSSQRLEREKFDWQKKAQEQSLDIEAKKLAAAGMAKESQELREFGIGGMPDVERDKNGEVVMGEDGQPKVKRGGPLVNSDNRPFLARDAQTARDLTTKSHVARQMTNIYDKLINLRGKVGGESKLINSEERMLMDQLKNEIVLLRKSGTQGMSSDSDLKRIEESLGVADIASFREQMPKLIEGRRRTVEAFNGELQANQYSGKPVEFPDAYKRSAKQEEADKDVVLLSKNPSTIGSAAADVETFAKDPVAYRKARAESGGMSAEQKEALRMHGEKAMGKNATPAERARAVNVLEQTIKNPGNKNIKEYAQQLLTNASGADMFANTTEETPPTGRSTERDRGVR